MSGRFYKSKTRQAHWQVYQYRLKRAAFYRKFKKRLTTILPAAALGILLICGLVAGIQALAQRDFSSSDEETPAAAPDLKEQQTTLQKHEIRSILEKRGLNNLTEECFHVMVDGHRYRVDTSIDSDLQRILLNNLSRDHARYIGVVAVEPSTGRVLAMAGYDRTDTNNNPCIDARFPAASIFKIVTAAAGIEKCGFNPSSRFAFNGGKYTLYRYQLRDRTNKYTNWISLKDSFAQSVNPVFGKIGANHLGRVPLETYADAFGFNRTIEFELPLSPSHMSLSDDSYQWAEVASGFNRHTTLSPLHGALMVAAIMNGGDFIEPTIVDSITDETGVVRYRSQPQTVCHAFSEDTSKVLNRLMIATVKSGTSRKAFRSARKDQVLSRLKIGGKTGSISSREIQHMRYDWFVGFATEKSGEQKLAIAAIVAHEKFIGKRAADYAKLLIKQYFTEYFDRREAARAEDKEKNRKKDSHSLSFDSSDGKRMSRVGTVFYHNGGEIACRGLKYLEKKNEKKFRTYWKPVYCFATDSMPPERGVTKHWNSSGNCAAS